MEITHLDQAGINMMIKFEGCVLHPYLDQVKVPTIGIGMTFYPDGSKKVTMQDPPITQQQANDMFLAASKPFALTVFSTTPHTLTQNQFNALFSLCYNIGTSHFKTSTVLRLVNEGIAGEQLKAAFLLWTKAGGKVLQDLVKRRTQEYEIYMS